MPVSALQSPAEAQVDGDLPWGQGLWLQQTWEIVYEPQHRATKQTTHKLENNYIKEVLILLQKFQGPQKISQPGDPAKRLRTLREFDFGGRWDLIIELPQDWGNRLLEGTNKTLCAPRDRRKEQCPHKRLS